MGFLIYIHTCVYDVFFHLKTCLGDLPMGDLFLPVDPNPTHCFNQFPGASWCEWTVTQHRDCAKNAYVLIRFSISYRSVFNAPYSLPSFPSASLLFLTHTGQPPASGALHLLLQLPGALPPPDSQTHVPLPHFLASTQKPPGP